MSLSGLFVGAIIIGGSIASIAYFELKRTKELAAYCLKQGFQFLKDSNPSLRFIDQFYLSSIGHSKVIKNHITGRYKDFDLDCFDYFYTTGSGKHSTQHQQSVLILKADGIRVPPILLKPEGFWDHVAQFFGAQDINFPQSPEFSSKYVLKGQHEAEVRAYMTPRILQYFTDHPGLCVEARDHEVLYYHPNKRLSPEKLNEFFDQGTDIARVFLK